MRCPAIVFLLIGLTALFKPVVADDDEPRTYGSSWSSNNGQWSRKSRYSNVQHFETRPEGVERLPFRVEWRPVEVDALGRFARVSGTLEITDGPHAGAVKWFQGVTVCLALLNDDQPDWSSGVAENNSVYQVEVLKRDGSFSVRFDLREVEYDRDSGIRLQAAIALAEHVALSNDQQRVIYRSATPVLGQSVGMLTIPQAPPLPEQLKLIGNANQWPKSSTVDLIRAVNSLQQCGKAEAIRHLQQYTELATENGEFDFDEVEIVAWIVHLLFAPARPGGRRPFPPVMMYIPIGDDRQASAVWPYDPIAVIDDVPFMVGGTAVAFSGSPPNPADHIVWAQRYGIIRDRPLEPTSTPMEAADRLLRSRRFLQMERADQGPWDDSRRRICDQALAMIGDAVPMQTRFGNKDAVVAEWQERLKDAKTQRFQWDSNLQNFVPQAVEVAPE